MITNFQLHIWCLKFIRPAAMNKLSLLLISKSNCSCKKIKFLSIFNICFSFWIYGKKMHEPSFPSEAAALIPCAEGFRFAFELPWALTRGAVLWLLALCPGKPVTIYPTRRWFVTMSSLARYIFNCKINFFLISHVISVEIYSLHSSFAAP